MHREVRGRVATTEPRLVKLEADVNHRRAPTHRTQRDTESRAETRGAGQGRGRVAGRARQKNKRKEEGRKTKHKHRDEREIKGESEIGRITRGEKKKKKRVDRRNENVTCCVSGVSVGALHCSAVHGAHAWCVRSSPLERATAVQSVRAARTDAMRAAGRRGGAERRAKRGRGKNRGEEMNKKHASG